MLRTRVRDLENAMMIGNDALRTTFLLPPKLSDILGVLVSLNVVTTDMLDSRLELATEPKVAIHRLRQALTPFGIKIESANRVGYWLTDETKAEIRRRIAEKNPTTAAATEAA